MEIGKFLRKKDIFNKKDEPSKRKLPFKKVKSVLLTFSKLRANLFSFPYLFNLGMVGIVSLGLFIFYFWTYTPLKSFAQVKRDYRPSDVWLVDRHFYLLESIRHNHKKRSLEWVSLEQISPSFQKLLIQGEDHRFYSHTGVDFIAIAHTIFDSLRGRPLRGASTLTMQLTGLLKNGELIQRRNVGQKFLQMIAAIKMETEWSKEEVLEAYVNLVPLRGELVGLRAASLGFFSKNPSGLNDSESALLVALLRSPNADPLLVSNRACLMLRQKDCTALKILAQETFSKPYQLKRSRELVPVVSSVFIEKDSEIENVNTNLKNSPDKSNSSIIHTTLDRDIQERTLKILQAQLQILKNQNVHDGAVVVLEAATGKALAYVANGGMGYTSAIQVDGVQSLRQAGSTIKPFVYGTAFDLQLLKANSLLEDSPADITISGGRVYHPRNYDQTFRGFVGVGEALGSSLNVPAVRALGLIGEARVLDLLRLLGFSHLQYDDYYGPSLALGAVDVTLWELTQGYRKIFSEASPFSQSTRDILFNILAAPEYRRFTFGIESALSLPFTAAVKTGTSKDMRDNWCIGGSSKYFVGVWVGNFKGDPMWNVSGMSGAAPIWREVMLSLHPHSEIIPTSYIPPEKPLNKRTLSHIRYPAPFMLVGLDPDIPPTLQKLPIEIENPQPNHQLYVNKHLIGKAQELSFLSLKTGRFKIELKSATGDIIDSVSFEVR